MWFKKPSTLFQLLVSDIRLETFRPRSGVVFETVERVPSELVPSTAASTPSASIFRAVEAALKPTEQ